MQRNFAAYPTKVGCPCSENSVPYAPNRRCLLRPYARLSSLALRLSYCLSRAGQPPFFRWVSRLSSLPSRCFSCLLPVRPLPPIGASSPFLPPLTSTLAACHPAGVCRLSWVPPRVFCCLLPVWLPPLSACCCLPLLAA